MNGTKKEAVASTNSVFSTKSIAMIALFIALTCVAAYISIPLPLPGAPHLTLQNFVILLIALLLPMSEAFTTIILWMILGILGLPVFISGGASFGYIAQAWGGYTVAFPLLALILPLLRGEKYNRIRYTIVAVFGALFIDVYGMIWLMEWNQLSLAKAFAMGFVPFLVVDVLKAIVVAQIIPALRLVIHNSKAQ